MASRENDKLFYDALGLFRRRRRKGGGHLRLISQFPPVSVPGAIPAHIRFFRLTPPSHAAPHSISISVPGSGTVSATPMGR